MTRAAPASAPILRPGVKGAGRGRGAADVSWASRSSRREELASRRNIWAEMTQWEITGDWASFLTTQIETKITLNLFFFPKIFFAFLDEFHKILTFNFSLISFCQKWIVTSKTP